MATDIKLDDGSDSTWVTVEGNVLNAKTSDLILDSVARTPERWRELSPGAST